MSEFISSRVKQCTENEAWAMAVFLYRLSFKVDSPSSYEEFQILYLALVSRLRKEEQADKILNTAIKKLIQKKQLCVIKNISQKYKNPYDKKGNLKMNFDEDRILYDQSCAWKSNTERAVNTIRVIFSKDGLSLTKLIGLTFFCSFPEKVNLNQSIKIPESCKNAINDVSPVKTISNILKLKKDEEKVLNICFMFKHYIEFGDIIDNLNENDDYTYLELYSICLKLDQKSIRSILSKDSKLITFSFLNDEGKIYKDAYNAILEEDIKFYFTDIIKRGSLSNTYKMNSFSIQQNKISLAVHFLKSSSCNILLYGVPGSGKTEFAKSLVKSTGLKLHYYKNSFELEDYNSTLQAIGQLNCYLSLTRTDSILIVDEAESILKTSYSCFGGKCSLPQKGAVNKMLEQSNNKVIWILNYTNELDESTLRRFTYSIRFREMPKQTLCNIAEKKLNSIKMSSNLRKELVDMCGKFHVTGASVDNIVKAVSSMDCSDANREQILGNIKDVLESNSKLIYGNSEVRTSVSGNYDLSVLNTSIPAEDIVSMVKNAISTSELLVEGSKGIRMLFYGLSGTGKTELAHYIAEKTDKKLLIKKASDILGMYVGESEQKVKEAFQEAADTDSILLFDEADTFFGNRENAVRSWERSLVNEFLTQMEAFDGIVICTTKLRNIMDPAMQRRFHIITEFKPLEEKGIELLLYRYFSDFVFSQKEIQSLSKMDSVTPGDFSSLSGRIRFMPKEKITGSYIINELLQIQKEKISYGSTRIGFAG